MIKRVFSTTVETACKRIRERPKMGQFDPMRQCRNRPTTVTAPVRLAATFGLTVALSGWPGAALAAETACGEPVAGEATTGQVLIGSIVLDRRPIFDTSLPEEDKALYRLANRYHVLTRESTIRSQLLFEPGDAYSPRLAEESERLLRGRLYLVEASIRPIRYRDGVVDVCVTTQDVWTLKPDFSYERAGGENEIYVELEDLNLAGTGAALSLSYSSDNERDSAGIRFSDPQLGRSRVALSASLADNSDGHQRFLGIERPFFALDTRWSAGIRLFDEKKVAPLYDLGNKVLEFGQARSLLQISGGRSRGLVDGWARRLSAGVVFDDYDFFRPDSTLAGAVPANRKLVYPFVAVELLEDEFVKTANQDQIGRTEDIYIGTRLTASLGWSATGFGADRERFVFAGQASTGFGTPDRVLWLVNAGVHGRYEQRDLRNTVLSARLRYYRRQSEKRLFFASLATDAGERLDLDNPVRLGGNTGLRGYPLAYQNGASRLVATLEQRYFTDWYPLRLVRIGGAIFADVGRTWGRNPAGGSGSLGWLSDVGFGLRLTSPRSSTGSVLHIDLAFPLDGDDSIDSVQLLVEGRRSF